MVEAYQERQRRFLQSQAIIAWGQAGLICRQLSGISPPALYELFPFWTSDEVNEMKLREYRSRMERLAAKGGDSVGR